MLVQTPTRPRPRALKFRWRHNFADIYFKMFSSFLFIFIFYFYFIFLFSYLFIYFFFFFYLFIYLFIYFFIFLFIFFIIIIFCFYYYYYYYYFFYFFFSRHLLCPKLHMTPTHSVFLVTSRSRDVTSTDVLQNRHVFCFMFL